MQAAYEQSAPIYKLCREVKTIPDLWREWTVGLGGRLSIEELDRHWKSAWRPVSERQYYSTRKRIIDEVRRQAGDMGNYEDVIGEMERERQMTGMSLDRVWKTLRKAAKAREVEEDIRER